MQLKIIRRHWGREYVYAFLTRLIYDTLNLQDLTIWTKIKNFVD